jgi:hemerythrin-like metal-binding protein
MMRTIVWKEENSVGVKDLDQQHKEVVAYLNKMFEIISDPSQPDQLSELFQKLEQYAVDHFSAEETLFEKYKYLDKESHISEHDVYRNTMKKLRHEIDSDDKHVNEDILGFLADWWMGHIQGCDKEYTRFLNNNGVF